MYDRNTVRVLLRGGLGNQLFQYFSARELARDISASLILDARLLPTAPKHAGWKASEFPEQISHFFHDGVLVNSKTTRSPIDHASRWVQVRIAQWGRALGGNRLSTIGRLVHLSGNEPLKERPSLAYGRNSVLNHSFLNPMLFSYTKDKSVIALNSISNPTNWFVSMKKQILSTQPIAIHHRLGDHVRLGTPASLDYIKRSLNHLQNLPSTDSIIVFSDEITRSKEILGNLPFRFEFIEPPIESPPIESLVLMANSRALVMSSSSFSWWAATLGDNLKLTAVINRNWLDAPSTPEFFRDIPGSWIRV
jgi:hypothetical protein